MSIDITQYKQQWENHCQAKAQPNWLQALRQTQFENFLQQGFPTPKSEQWKYTNLASFNLTSFLPFSLKQSGISEAAASYLNEDCLQLVFINGSFVQSLSDSFENKQGIIITHLDEAIEKYPQLLRSHLEEYEYNSLTALNVACMSDGAFVYIPANCRVDKPIRLLFLAEDHSNLQNCRNVILAEENSKVTLLEEHESFDQVSYIANVVTQIQVQPNAQVDYTKIQNQNLQSIHLANTLIAQGKNSMVRTQHLSLGGKLSRDDISCQLNESGASLSMQGLYLPLLNQHIDIHANVLHNADYTGSEEFFKGIIGQKSRAVFNGAIKVNKDIKQAAANLQNKNLLLSSDSEVYTKPELEIYSDDVKCRHGATIGQVDSNMLFYLCSRGLEKREAYQLLVEAFISDNLAAVAHLNVVGKIRNLLTSHNFIRE